MLLLQFVWRLCLLWKKDEDQLNVRSLVIVIMILGNFCSIYPARSFHSPVRLVCKPSSGNQGVTLRLNNNHRHEWRRKMKLTKKFVIITKCVS